MLTLFENAQLLEFNQAQLIYTALLFVWSGFVRSGLGFGGAALTLPFMMFIHDQPLFWLPVIGTHLLIFTSLTLRTRIRHVDWEYLKSSSIYIIPAKLIGVFGLISLPNNWLVVIIYVITMLYAMMWLFNYHLQSESGWTDKFLLFLGGYVSGVSLTGAPLMVAVYMHHVSLDKLRNTLFVLWFLLVTIKMSTLALFAIDLQFDSALLLVPVAAIGHVAGLKMHDLILRNDKTFKRIIGGVLLLICLLGLIRL